MAGRSGRRRKRKARAILEAAAAAEASSSRPRADAAHDAGPAPAVPSDRSQTLEGVRIRRREERREGSSGERGDGPDGSAHVKPEDEGRPSSGEEGDALDPDDARALRAQLGFVPGNAVCVAARMPKELADDATSGDGTNNGASSSRTPSVVKLYPLAVREPYRGGKSDGRAFKGRRRGDMRTGVKDHNTDGQNASDGGEKGKERAWTVGPAEEDEKRDASSTQEVSPNEGSNNDNRPKQEDPPQQIIEPFPTLYWLTCPVLRASISRIELSKTHGVPQMERRLRSSPAHLEQMRRAHASYGKARWELLTDDDRENVTQRGWKAALDEGRGVAGINLGGTKGHGASKGNENGNQSAGGWDRVKCLHAHAAHYLAQRAERTDGREEGNDVNLVGKWTMEAVLESRREP